MLFEAIVKLPYNYNIKRFNIFTARSSFWTIV